MSDPYGYNQQQQYGGYGQPPPHQQYPPHQGSYAPPPQPSYAGSTSYGQPYEQLPQHHQQQPQYNQDPAYGQSQQYGGYGPPAQGGFQHAQVAPSHGQYTAQTYSGYDQHQQQRQDVYPGSQPGQGQFPQQGAYNQNPYPGDPNSPEADRGMKGALAGGAAGYYGGKKSGHGVLGALGGMMTGHLAEEALKKKKHGSGGHHGRREME